MKTLLLIACLIGLGCSDSNILISSDKSEAEITNSDSLLINTKTYIIRRVNIVDVNKGTIDSSYDVLVTDGRISKIEKNIQLQDSVYEIDGTGKYLLPGLFNMHTHAIKPNDYFLCIANGVTNVRHMWGNEGILSLKDQFNLEPFSGPNIYASSAGFEEPPSNWPGANLIQDKNGIKSLVADQAAAGFQFLKVYENISRENYLELYSQSLTENIPLVGHIPYSISLAEVLKNNYQLTIEHIDSYLESTGKSGTSISNPTGFQFDEDKLDEIIRLTANSDVWNCPTLTITTRSREDHADLRNEPYLKYVSPNMRSWFAGTGASWSRSVADQYTQHKFKLVKALSDGGAKLVLGVDTGLRYLIPGVSVHEELSNFVAAGISIPETLKIATINCAESLGIESELGSITKGKKADFLMLNTNPLVDIGNTKDIHMVIRGDYLLSVEYIEAKLNEIASTYN